VSCAAAHGVLDAFEQDDVLGNAGLRHKELLQHLGRIQSAAPGFIREVRGAGLMIGIDLETKAGGAYGAQASAVQAAALRRGLLLLVCGPYDTLRLIPALTMSAAELTEGMDILLESVKEVAAAQ
jgi:4-aminobutyrate aminotransferase